MCATARPRMMGLVTASGSRDSAGGSRSKARSGRASTAQDGAPNEAAPRGWAMAPHPGATGRLTGKCRGEDGMDVTRIDAAARLLAATGHRRSVARLLAAALAGATFAAATGRAARAGAGCFKRGKRCRRRTQCCTLNCRNGWCR